MWCSNENIYISCPHYVINRMQSLVISDKILNFIQNNGEAV